jgi:hypothetical protein
MAEYGGYNLEYARGQLKREMLTIMGEDGGENGEVD